jgi:transposase
MKSASTITKPGSKYGPGASQPDTAFMQIEDLPRPKIIKENRNESHRPCPACGKPARQEHVYHRQLHDVGDLVSGRPVELHLTYSQHHGKACNQYFMTDLSDLAPPGSQYTHRVISRAVRCNTESATMNP